MKRIFSIITSLVFLVTIASGQKTHVTSKAAADTGKIQTLKTTPPNVYKPKPPAQTAPVQDMNALLPDITILSFKINYIGSQDNNGVLKHTFEITYELKNQGNISVSADSIDVHGFISYQTPSPSTIPACGALISPLPGLVLAPGATHRGSYRCTSIIDKANNPVYVLYVDYPNIVRELNEQNNKAQLPITF